MTVEIIPFTAQQLSMQITISPATRTKLRPIPPNVVPEGCDAKVAIDGIEYVIRDFRGRPRHEPGAIVTGDGYTEKLNSQNPMNAINRNIFRYIQPHE